MVALGVFKPEPRYLVPVGGMVVGNSMTAAAVALNRLGDEVTRHAREIEATLALGASSTQAAAPIVRRSLRSGMIPLIDSTKTTGLVFFPGTMVGMLLAELVRRGEEVPIGERDRDQPGQGDASEQAVEEDEL